MSGASHPSLKWLAAFSVLAILTNAPALPRYHGVSFTSLNGWIPCWPKCPPLSDPDDEKLSEVLDNLGDSGTIARLNGTFAEYQKAGVNVIRLIICPQWPGFPALADGRFTGEYPPTSLYPDNVGPLDARIEKVNAFMNMASKFGIKFCINFSTPRWDTTKGQHFRDLPPYSNDKAWIRRWVERLDQSRIVLFNLASEVVVWYKDAATSKTYYYPDPHILPGYLSFNHGSWVKHMYPWFKKEFPAVPMSFEFFSMDVDPDTSLPNGRRLKASPELFRGIADWIDANTPNLTYASLELYFYLPGPPKGPSRYKATAQSLLSAYFDSKLYRNRKTPLWIDEFGHSVCSAVTAKCQATEVDQADYMAGVLEAMHSYSPSQISGRVLWAGSNDYPHDNVETFGLFSGYSGSKPITRPAWELLRKYYLGNPAPGSSGLLKP